MHDFLEEHFGGVLIAIVALLALLSQTSNIQGSIARSQATAAATKNRQAENEKLGAETLSMKRSRDIANGRYDSGCEVLSTLKSFGVAAPIQEGKPIVAGAYAAQFDRRNPNPDHYIGRDLIVCDLYGTTAITAFNPTLGYAVAESLATTNDRDRMARAQARRPGLTRPNLTK
jgi:hypothetical protein